MTLTGWSFLLTIYFLTALPSWQVRFFLFRLEDASGTLTVQSRTLRSGANDNVLWFSEISQGYSWQRAEATFSSSDNSKVREDQDFHLYHRVRSWDSGKRTCYNFVDSLFLLRLSSGMKVVMDTEGLLRWTTSLSQGSAYLTLQTATCQTPHLHPAQQQPQTHPQAQQAPPIHVR